MPKYNVVLSGPDAVGFPGHLAFRLDFCGCKFKCPFCYVHRDLKDCNKVSLEDIVSEISEHIPLVSGVILTGGEPTEQNIIPLARSIKSMGLAVKLETNGMNPHMVGKLVHSGLVDLVSVSIKAPPGVYSLLERSIGISISDYWKTLSETLEYSSKVDSELVYLVIPGFNDDVNGIEHISKVAREFGIRLVLEEFDPELASDPSFVYPRPNHRYLVNLASHSYTETWIKTRKGGYEFAFPGRVPDHLM